MKFTELTVEEYDQYMWKTEAMSHYFQMKENIENRERKGYPVVLLGVKKENASSLQASSRKFRSLEVISTIRIEVL